MTGETTSNGMPEGGERPGDAPGIDESLRSLNAARRDAIDATRGSARALRRLIAADFALARSAFGRGLAWACAGIVFGASAWLLITGTLIALMQRYGMSWLMSLFLGALLSSVAAGYSAWRVARFFDYTGMHATRRQLTRLGVFDEHGDEDDDEPPAAGTAHDPRAADHGGP